MIIVAKETLKKNETFHQQIGLNVKGKASEVLHLECSFVW
jgi:hypothetical protein